MVDYVRMGLRLRKKRREKKLAQQELARAVNISASYYSNIERGIRIPSIDTLVAIANVLEIGLDALLSDSLITSSDHMSTDDLRVISKYLRDKIAELDYGGGDAQ